MNSAYRGHQKNVVWDFSQKQIKQGTSLFSQVFLIKTQQNKEKPPNGNKARKCQILEDRSQ